MVTRERVIKLLHAAPLGTASCVALGILFYEKSIDDGAEATARRIEQRPRFVS